MAPVCAYSAKRLCCPPCCLCSEMPGPHPLRPSAPVTSGSYRWVCCLHSRWATLRSAVQEWCSAVVLPCPVIVTTGVHITDCDRVCIQIQICFGCEASVSGFVESVSVPLLALLGLVPLPMSTNAAVCMRWPVESLMCLCVTCVWSAPWGRRASSR